MIHALADFLIGSEPNFDGAMLYIRIFHQVFNGGHDLGNASLVISAQKGGPISGN